MHTRRSNAYTLVEVLTSAALLLLLLGMLSTPLQMLSSAMKKGQGQIDAQQAAKLALAKMMRELMGGYLTEVSGTPSTSPDTDPPPAGTPANSNVIRYYTTPDALNGNMITFGLNAQHQLVRTVYNSQGGTYPNISWVQASATPIVQNLTLVNFQPKYWDYTQSLWSSYTLPVGPLNTTPGNSDTPPNCHYAVTQGAIMQIQAQGTDPATNASFEYETSYMTRN